MARNSTITPETLIPLIRMRGPISATELAGLLLVNRTTIVRCLADIGDDLAILGATRSTRYVMRRNVLQSGNRWPLYRLNESGQTHEWAHLEAFHERGWRVDWAGSPPEWAAHFTQENHLWSGFPFFLSDARPQGFLGRLMTAKIAPILRLPDDIRRWGDDDILLYLETMGVDVPGNIVVGQNALKIALSNQTNQDFIKNSENFYPRLAERATSELFGSSAGGEQPKFTANLLSPDGELRSVIVKYTAPVGSEVGRRWADLLVCEFHAHEILAEAGYSNHGARLLDSGGRRFLEIPRFDRTGSGGRRGVISLEALASASVGLQNNWHTAGAELRKIGLIDDETLSQINVLHTFGELIGNTDMHSGNLSFLFGDEMPFKLTPAYDMLPMLWAPSAQGEMPERVFSPARPLPSMAAAWPQAVSLAADFWKRVANDERLSPSFSNIANEAGKALNRIV